MRSSRVLSLRFGSRSCSRKPAFETLDERTLLDAGGISAFMSLSFVPDGTEVSSQQSRLFDSLDQVASSAEWQRSIEGAFNDWAMHTNADISIVPDSGDPLGVPGRREEDSRFGDVRVAAVPLADNVMAISFPRDNVALGTWSSDIILNSNANWQSLDQITAIALHEAGHIFGLEHSDDPASAMYSHGTSNVTEPIASDITSLQFLFGDRSIDPNEDDEEGSNDDLEFATDLVGNLGGDVLAVSYGDISTPEDTDIYRIATEEEIEGFVFIEVQANGLSLLSPVVELLNEDGELLESVEAEDGVARLPYELDEEETLFVSVRADQNSSVQVGRYSISVAVTEEEFDDDEHDEFSNGALYLLNQPELEDYVRSLDDEPLFDTEDNANNEFANAQLLQPTSTNAGRTWYEHLGSISVGSDLDVYMIESPDDIEDVQNVMTVNIQSVTSGALIPEVSVFNEEGEPVETEIVVNGNGELVLQTLAEFDVDSEEGYFVVVEAANPTGAFAFGNYKMTINYGSDFVDLVEFSNGTLTAESLVQIRPLHVASPQLMHFLLDVQTEVADLNAVVAMEVFDAAGNEVFSLATLTDHARTGANPLLLPGTYLIRIGLVGDVPDNFSVDYQISGISDSNPLGVIPVDPTTEPVFTCDGMSDQFCYPGGTTSDSPFFWDDFIQDHVDLKADSFSASDPESFWWDWYFQNDSNGQNSSTAPSTAPDQFRVINGSLTVPFSSSVLLNDVSNVDSPLVAAVHAEPQHGVLNLATDGSFHYSPDVGFFGVDSFAYQAFDSSASIPTTVTIRVSRPGDLDDDGQVAFADFLVFARNFNTNQATWEQGDFDGDGRVSFEDFLLLSDNFGVAN